MKSSKYIKFLWNAAKFRNWLCLKPNVNSFFFFTFELIASLFSKNVKHREKKLIFVVLIWKINLFRMFVGMRRTHICFLQKKFFFFFIWYFLCFFFVFQHTQPMIAIDWQLYVKSFMTTIIQRRKINKNHVGGAHYHL